MATVSSPKILSQCTMNASRSLAGKAAIRFASRSCWCSKNIGRSVSITSRSWTSFVKERGMWLSILLSYSPYVERPAGLVESFVFSAKHAGRCVRSLTCLSYYLHMGEVVYPRAQRAVPANFPVPCTSRSLVSGSWSLLAILCRTY
jgi:hypothetical protein